MTFNTVAGAIDSIAITTEDQLPAFARITGGGWRTTGSGGEAVRSSHGLTLHCDILLSNNLQINWDRGQKWHIDKVVEKAFCDDSPFFTPEPPAAPADTYVGVDSGKLNNSGTAIACWVFEDHGEIASDTDGEDRALIRIFTGIELGDYTFEPSDVDVTDPSSVENACPLPVGATEVLFVPLSDLAGGNLQFHFDQPHK